LFPKKKKKVGEMATNNNASNPTVIVDERVTGIVVDQDRKLLHLSNTSNSSSPSINTNEQIFVKKSKTASYFNVLFSGFALLSDGYQSGVISFVNLFLGKIYGPDVFNADMKSRLSYAMFVGAIVGQLGKLHENFLIIVISFNMNFLFNRFRFDH
jgi:hypothetical protein